MLRLEIPNKIPPGKDRRHGHNECSQSQMPREIARERSHGAELDELLSGVRFRFRFAPRARPRIGAASTSCSQISFPHSSGARPLDRRQCQTHFTSGLWFVAHDSFKIANPEPKATIES